MSKNVPFNNDADINATPPKELGRQDTPLENIAAKEHSPIVPRTDEEVSQNRGGTNQGQQVSDASKLTENDEHKYTSARISATENPSQTSHATGDVDNASRAKFNNTGTLGNEENHGINGTAESKGQSILTIFDSDKMQFKLTSSLVDFSWIAHFSDFSGKAVSFQTTNQDVFRNILDQVKSEYSFAPDMHFLNANTNANTGANSNRIDAASTAENTAATSSTHAVTGTTSSGSSSATQTPVVSTTPTATASSTSTSTSSTSSTETSSSSSSSTSDLKAATTTTTSTPAPSYYIYGTTGDDTISGNNVGQTIYAYSGNDTVNAGSGADTIYGGTGIDTFYGGTGTDTSYGGDGNDVFCIQTSFSC